MTLASRGGIGLSDDCLHPKPRSPAMARLRARFSFRLRSHGSHAGKPTAPRSKRQVRLGQAFSLHGLLDLGPLADALVVGFYVGEGGKIELEPLVPVEHGESVGVRR